MSVIPTRSTFTLGREPPFPSLYPENKTAVTVDVLEVGWIVSFLTLYFCYLIIMPAIPGKEKIYYFLRVTLTLFIGLVIVLCLFGQEWEIGEVTSPMFYKAGSHQEINGTVAVRMGLSAINITLKAEDPQGDLSGEKIDYNERFYWSNGAGQGRFGFGPNAAELNQEFRAAQRRGAPYPILWVAEYFTFDGEGLRFGRNYRLAGFYSRICIWTCFPVWLITIILFKMVIRYGAVLLSLLGTLLFLSSLIWTGRRNFQELAIVFTDEHILKTYYGVHWYLALIVGLLCLVSGILIYILDTCFHNQLCKLFGIDPFNIFEEEYEDEVEPMPMMHPTDQENIEMGQFGKKRRLRATISIRPRGQMRIGEKTFVGEISPGGDEQDLYDENFDPFSQRQYENQVIPRYNQGYQQEEFLNVPAEVYPVGYTVQDTGYPPEQQFLEQPEQYPLAEGADQWYSDVDQPQAVQGTPQELQEFYQDAQDAQQGATGMNYQQGY